MDALLQVDAVTSSQNTRPRRKLFDHISCPIRSLKSLGIESDSYGGLLCPVILNKIPADLQLIISRKVSGDDWKLDLLVEAIGEEITARERVIAGQSRPPARRSTSEQKPPPTATALVSGEPSNIQTPCCYCDQLHSPELGIWSSINSRGTGREGVTNKQLDTTLQSFWELESLGIQSPNNDPVSNQFTSTIQMKEGRYEVSLPWREYHEPLPDNYNLSRRRLHGLVRRLKQEPTILREYDAIIRDQLERRIVEVAQDTNDNPQMIHYLPHHAVIRRDKKTTKVRVVYDASARSSGPSLNDCLHTGPKFNQKILEILLRFRSYPVALVAVALVADMEKAFFMISMAPKDRDVLRFLWLKDAFQENPDIVKLRFTRVVFGVSPSPFLLNATIKHHLEKYVISHPELVKILTQSIYVDDAVCGADTEEDAFTLYASSKEVLSHGSFNLRKFVTNSPTLQKSIDSKETIPMSRTNTEHDVTVEASEETYVESTLPITHYSCPNEQKVLGVRCNVTHDQLVISLDGMVETAAQVDPTKRNVVSLIGQIYDPLGFISPVTIQFKKLMQVNWGGTSHWRENY